MALIERLQKTMNATFWPGKIPMNYVYTAGRAGETFFKRIKDKWEFVGYRCERCGTIYLPPRIFCERCFERIEGNEVKVALEAAYEAKKQALERGELATLLEKDRIDVTLSGRPVALGRIHISTKTLREIYAIFAQMGFQVYTARDVELDLYNFELLNMPPGHPARDMWDTFYATHEGVLLRTHTSPGQIHAMREY